MNKSSRPKVWWSEILVVNRNSAAVFVIIVVIMVMVLIIPFFDSWGLWQITAWILLRARKPLWLVSWSSHIKLYVQRVSAKVQLANMQAVVAFTSWVLAHWQVVFSNEHPTVGIVNSKHSICINNQQSTSFQPQNIDIPHMAKSAKSLVRRTTHFEQ